MKKTLFIILKCINLLNAVKFTLIVFQINGLFAGYTPLQAACQNGAIDVVKLLIHRGIELEAEVC